jgi:hypothetical protein
MKHHLLNNRPINLIVNDQISLALMNPLNLLQHDQLQIDLNRVSLEREMMIHKQNVKEVHGKVYEVGLNQQIFNIVIDHLLP